MVHDTLFLLSPTGYHPLTHVIRHIVTCPQTQGCCNINWLLQTLLSPCNMGHCQSLDFHVLWYIGTILAVCSWWGELSCRHFVSHVFQWCTWDCAVSEQVHLHTYHDVADDDLEVDQQNIPILVIVRGNPGVFQLYSYPTPWKPLPHQG
jgi:hypothetical protein